MTTEITNTTEDLNIRRDMFIGGLSNWKIDIMKLNRMKYEENKRLKIRKRG